MQDIRQIIDERLKTSFKPAFLEVKNLSHLHAGHAGDDGSGQTHFKITIRAEVFIGKNKIECHRMVNEKLKDLYQDGLHSVTLKITN